MDNDRLTDLGSSDPPGLGLCPSEESQEPVVAQVHVDTPPVGTTPVDAAPVDTEPVDTAPVDTAPVDTAPVQAASVDAAPEAVPVAVPVYTVNGVPYTFSDDDIAWVQQAYGECLASLDTEGQQALQNIHDWGSDWENNMGYFQPLVGEDTGVNSLLHSATIGQQLPDSIPIENEQSQSSHRMGLASSRLAHDHNGNTFHDFDSGAANPSHASGFDSAGYLDPNNTGHTNLYDQNLSWNDGYTTLNHYGDTSTSNAATEYPPPAQAQQLNPYLIELGLQSAGHQRHDPGTPSSISPYVMHGNGTSKKRARTDSAHGRSPDGGILQIKVTPQPSHQGNGPSNLGAQTVPVPYLYQRQQAEPLKKRARKDARDEKRGYDELLCNAADWDFEIPAGLDINCTIVEIIVFLPRWFQQRWIATRFCNNGITPPVHRIILRTHRIPPDKEHEFDFHRNSILVGYQNAMRGPQWRARLEEAKANFKSRHPDAEPQGQLYDNFLFEHYQEVAWVRGSHRTPDDWDATVMAVNDFQPDRIRLKTNQRRIEGFPFTRLSHDVDKFPQGPDAADLTRAIEFAMNHRRLILGVGTAHEYLFPDHWHEILDVIGRTQITPAHHDGACITWYSRLTFPTLDKNTAASPTVAAHTRPPIALASNIITDPLVAPQQPEPVVVQESIVAPQLPPGLIQDDHPPAPHDFSYRAQVVRFAQLPDQLNNDWTWNPLHVTQINHSLTDGWIAKLNHLLDDSQAPRWRDVDIGHLSDEVGEVVAFANSGMQQLIRWRVDEAHARVLGHIDIADIEQNVEALADVVHGFRYFYHANNTERQHAHRYKLATLECARLLRLK